MSTRSSVWFWDDEDKKHSVHLYREMHDDLYHLAIESNTNAIYNLPMPKFIAKILLQAVEERGEIVRVE